MARVLGVGGVFFKSPDPAALAAWYERWLGVELGEGFTGSIFQPAGVPPGGYTIWSPFAADTEYFDPSPAPFMINLMVDDLDGALAQVAEGGARVMEAREESEFGRFGWFLDPDGNKIELWQPPA
jgi:predicted enzyme related to lactoylglutathione lyase